MQATASGLSAGPCRTRHLLKADARAQGSKDGDMTTVTLSPKTVKAAPAPGVAEPLPPLQNRTPEQLKDGMFIKVTGAGSDDIAAARLIQDGASFIAKIAGTTVGLKNVAINDKSMDRDGALGMATFNGTDGWFGLSHRSTQGLLEGIKRLRETPFEKWTETDRAKFVQANETILHEAGHVTLPAYDRENVRAWAGANRGLEEGITEVVTMGSIGQFMKEEFDVDVPQLTDRISQSTSAYTRYSERIKRLLSMGTDGTDANVQEAARQVADNVRADLRQRSMAERIATNLGGADAPKALTDEITKTIDGFIAEQNGTRTRLMEIQSALVDFKASKETGKPFDLKKVQQELAKIDANIKTLAPPEVNGTKPIA